MISDSEIEMMISAPKYIDAKTSINPSRYLSMSDEGNQLRGCIKLACDTYGCEIRLRQNADRPSNFSVILVCRDRQGNEHSVLRLNGHHGRHRNYIEKNVIDGPHIHMMTERYQMMTTHPDGYAEPTDRYADLDGAFKVLVDEANIRYEGARRNHRLEDYDDRDDR